MTLFDNFFYYYILKTDLVNYMKWNVNLYELRNRLCVRYSTSSCYYSRRNVPSIDERDYIFVVLSPTLKGLLCMHACDRYQCSTVSLTSEFPQPSSPLRPLVCSKNNETKQFVSPKWRLQRQKKRIWVQSQMCPALKIWVRAFIPPSAGRFQ